MLETGTSYELLRISYKKTQQELVWKYAIIDKVNFF